MGLTGFLAGVLTLLTYVPQSVKTLRTRKTSDLSLPTLVLLSSSALLWVIYGLGEQLTSVWTTNIVVSVLGGAILVMKLRSRASERAARNRRQPRDLIRDGRWPEHEAVWSPLRVVAPAGRERMPTDDERETFRRRARRAK